VRVKFCVCVIAYEHITVLLKYTHTYLRYLHFFMFVCVCVGMSLLYNVLQSLSNQNTPLDRMQLTFLEGN